MKSIHTALNGIGADCCPGNPPPMSSKVMSNPMSMARSKTLRACLMATAKASASSHPLPTWKL